MWRAFDRTATATITPWSVTVPTWILHHLGYTLSRWDNKSYRLWCVITLHGVDTLVLNLMERKAKRANAVYITSRSHRYARVWVRAPVMRVLGARGSRKLRRARMTVIGYHQNCIAMRLYAKHS